MHPTAVHMLADAVARAPEREALVCGADRLSYAEYGRAVAAFAHELRGAGAAGERVVLLMPNGVDLAIGIFAALAAGAQATPLNPAYTAFELRPILTDASPRLILAAPAVADSIAPLVAELGFPAPWRLGSGARRLADVADAAEPELTLPDPDSLGILQYTGGTTGRAKGVNLTHRATAANIAQREAVVPTIPDRERALVMTPLYHVYATAMGLNLAANARGTLVLMERYTPEEALELIERERITFLAGSPTIYHGLLASERLGRTDLSSLSVCFSGASALPAETLARWQALTGAAICEGYGQTEAGPVLAANPRDGRRKPGSVGVVLPETTVEIVDPATGEDPLPAGEVGEIRARGPQVMSGYRNRPEETAAALRDGWLYTGDLGCFDPDGYLRIRDRKKDMVIVSGFNVFPREIEDVLHAHPDVREAAAFGVPDPRKGEVVHVQVVGARGLQEEALVAFLSERLVRYKWPADLKLVPELPKTAIGKIDKVALRETALGGRDAVQ